MNDAGFSIFRPFDVTTITTGGPFSLSSFNYLNRMDYGQFYHLADSTTTDSYLLSYFILSNTQIVLTNLQAYPTTASALTIPPTATAFTNYGSGDKLCWGSQS